MRELEKAYPQDQHRTAGPDRAADGGPLRRVPGDALDPPRRGRARAPHRLRQRRAPAPRAGRRPTEGVRDPRRARRRTAAARPAAPDRERSACPCWAAPSASSWRPGSSNPLVDLAPSEIPRLGDTRIDPMVLLFTLGACMLTGTLFGLAPAAQASRPDPQSALRETGPGATGSRTRQGLRRALFVSEVALAFVLAVGSGLLVRSLVRVQRVPLGFEPEGVLSLTVLLPDKGYEEEAVRFRFYERSLEELRRLPGVGVRGRDPLHAARRPLLGLRLHGLGPPDAAAGPTSRAPPSTSSIRATSRRCAIPLLAGRFFTEADRADAPKVVIVNESFAKRWWPDESPLGKRVKQGFPQDDRPFREIVGVVGDVAQEGLDLPVQTEVFLPLAQDSDSVDHVRRAHRVRSDVARRGPRPRRSTASTPTSRSRGCSRSPRRSPSPSRGGGSRRFCWASSAPWPSSSRRSASTASSPTASPSARARSGSARRSAPGRGRSCGWSSPRRCASRRSGSSSAERRRSCLTRFLAEPPLPDATVRSRRPSRGVAVLLTGVVLAACANPARRALRVSPTIALRSE